MSGNVLARDINHLAEVLAAEEVSLKELKAIEPVDCIVFCVSAISSQAEALFQELHDRPDLTPTLVLCGGIGHSTQYLYDTIARHPRFSSLLSTVQGLPEARVMSVLYGRYIADDRADGPRLLIEDRSANCGANAAETRRLLVANGITPRSFLIVQDPTMSLRTIASFQKAYEDGSLSPTFQACPIFVPQVVEKSGEPGGLSYLTKPDWDLWSLGRFLGLLLGEIPRVRDDEDGYGPRGKGFIGHVELPASVEPAWQRLKDSPIIRDLIDSAVAGR